MADILLPHNWRPRNYQMSAWKYMQGPAEGKRAACVWHRRAGKDLFAINVIATKVPERVGTYWHMLPTYKQGRNIVWNGFTRDGRAFLSHFPDEMVAAKNGTEMRVTFFNGANYQVVGTDDINSLVGTNPVGVVFSEYSLHDPGAWNYIRPILAENGGWALFIYTARGRNHGYTLLQLAKSNKRWFSEVLVAGDNGTKREDGTPVISDEVIEEERRSGMPEEMIQQEFYCSFEAPFIGAYYGAHMMRAERDDRIVEHIPLEPKLLVHTAWDLGVNDTMVVWFIQEHYNEIRLIDHYEVSGEGLPHMAKMLMGQVDGGEHRADYVYGTHYAPWDIAVRELGTGKSRIETAKSLGIRFRIGKQQSVDDGIEAVRNILPQCWFSATKCQRGIEALRQYRKAFDDKNKCFRNHPLHDWTSNSADALRTYAMNRRPNDGRNRSMRQERAIDDYQYV